MINFTTDDDYLKLAYDFETTVERPASTRLTGYLTPIEYTATGYTPMVFGEYTDENGRTFPCKSLSYDTTFPSPFSPVVVVLYTSNENVILDVFGDTADAVPHNVTVHVYVFMQSNKDVT